MNTCTDKNACKCKKNISRGEIIKVQSIVWYLILYDLSQILQNELFHEKYDLSCQFETYH